jgi:hypothetical protein
MPVCEENLERIKQTVRAIRDGAQITSGMSYRQSGRISGGEGLTDKTAEWLIHHTLSALDEIERQKDEIERLKEQNDRQRKEIERAQSRVVDLECQALDFREALEDCEDKRRRMVEKHGYKDEP